MFEFPGLVVSAEKEEASSLIEPEYSHLRVSSLSL